MSCGLSVSTPAHSDNACMFLLPLLPPFMCSVFTFELSHRLPFHACCPVVRPARFRAWRFEWAVLCFEEVVCADQPLLPGFYTLPSMVAFLEILPRRILNRLHSALVKSHVRTACTESCAVYCTICLSCLSQDLKLHSFVVAAAKPVSDFHIPVSSLFVNKYSRPSSPIDSHTKSSSARLRNLLECCAWPCSTSRYHYGSRSWCVPVPTIMELPPAFKGRILLTPLLDEEICSGQLAQCQPCWTFLWSVPIRSWSALLFVQVKLHVLQTSLWNLIEICALHLPSLAFPRACIPPLQHCSHASCSTLTL